MDGINASQALFEIQALIMVKKHLILLADDEEMVRNVAKAMLNHLNFDVIIANDGRQALEMFLTHQNELSLVILDISMPEMNGYECLEQIRKYSDLPALIASGYGSAISEEEIQENGFQGVLPKPFTLDVLEETIRSLLT